MEGGGCGRGKNCPGLLMERMEVAETFLGSVASSTSGKQQGEHTWRQAVSIRWADAGEGPRSLPSQADVQDCMVQEVLEEAQPTARSSSSSNDFLRLQF